MHGASNLTAPFIADVLAGKAQAGREEVVDAKVNPLDLRYSAALQLPSMDSSVNPQPHSDRQPSADEQLDADEKPRAAEDRAIGGVFTNFIEPMAIEVVLRPALLPQAVYPVIPAMGSSSLQDSSSSASPTASQHRCVNISLYFVDWTGTDPPTQGWGSSVQRKTAVDVFTVVPGVEIDVGYATAVVAHPQLADGEYRTWRVCADRLRANSTTGLGIVRFRAYVVTGNNATVSAIFFD
jgi:hypothetical protein